MLITAFRRFWPDKEKDGTAISQNEKKTLQTKKTQKV